MWEYEHLRLGVVGYDVLRSWSGFVDSGGAGMDDWDNVLKKLYTGLVLLRGIPDWRWIAYASVI